MQIQTHKIALVGNSGVGKTTWIKQLLCNTFEMQHIPTVGVEVHPITLFKDGKPTCYNMWDISGLEQFGGLRDGYLVGTQGAIVMCDSLDIDPCKTVKKHLKYLPRDIPIILVENVHEGYQARGIQLLELNLLYVPIHTKTNEQVTDPLHLLGSLLNV